MRTAERIANRYELERELGEGGMATVWLARDLTLQRPVAIKFLDAGGRDRARITEQFLREARIAASVRHRNVIQILDFGVHDGTPFMAMEALDGETMADRFERGEPFELREIIEIAARSLEGLSAVHEAGIIHRDLKPENIFLVREPTGVHPKLLDFGISKSLDKRDGRRSAIPTEPGRVIGTPEYMSPEQARGMTDLDPRTDIYAIGVVMYEALTGRLPYDAPHMGDVLVKVIAGGAPDVAQLVPDVGQAISDVVAKAMQRDRGLRHGSALEMRSALLAAAHPLLEGKDPISLPPIRGRSPRDLQAERADAPPWPSQLERAAASIDRSPSRAGVKPLWLAVAAAVTAVAAGAFALGRLRDPAGAAVEPRYIVVQGGKPETPETPAVRSEPVPPGDVPAPGGQTANPPAPSASPAEAGDGERAPRKPASPARRPAAEKAHEADAARALARAFEQQKAQVVQCLNLHADQVQERVQLSVRLALDTDGQVQSVDVMPAPIAATHLGSCIASAVRTMRFGTQPSPIAIRVPLTARRSAR